MGATFVVVAFVVVACLGLAVPAGAAAAPGLGGLSAASSPSVTGLASQLGGSAPGGPSPVGILSSGLGTASLDLVQIGVLNGAQAALRETATVINHTTAPRLQSTWFSSTYWRVAGLAALLTLPLLFAAAAQALLRADLSLLVRAAFGYLPLAMVGVSLAAPITMLLLSVTDEMSSVVAGAGDGGGVQFLRQTATVTAGLTALSGSPFLAIAIGLMMLGAAVALAIEMLVRETAVYVVVLMLPLAFAVLVWPARRAWAARIVELLIALVLSKFLIVAVLSLAGAAYGANGTPSVTRLLTAMALVLLSTLAPWVMLRLLPFSELAAGAGGAIRAELPRLASAPGEAMNAADGAAAWAERLSQRLRPSADNDAPAAEFDSGAPEDRTPGAVLAQSGVPAPGDAGKESAPAHRGPEGIRANHESPFTDGRAAERPGGPPAWLAEMGNRETWLGRTSGREPDDEQGSTVHDASSERTAAGSLPDSPQLPPAAPDDGPQPPSTHGEEGLL